MLALLAVTASACGRGAHGDDPASLVPAGAPLYAEASIGADGAQGGHALAAASKLLKTSDPTARLRDLVDEQLGRTLPGVSWTRDFAPWVGSRVGVWAPGLEQSPPSYALIFSSDDQDAAKEALDRLAARRHARPSSDDGVHYTIDDDGIAAGQIGDFVVVGTRDAFEQTVDGRDDDHLAETDSYQAAIGRLDRSRIGHYYIDSKRLLSGALRRGSDAAPQLRQFDALLGLGLVGPVAGAVLAGADGVTIDNVIAHVGDGPLRTPAATWWRGDSGVLPELPADAWGAFTIPQVGRSTAALIDSFARTLTGAALATRSRREVRLDPQHDVLAWAGDAGGFIRGKPARDGGVLVEATDARAASVAVRKLAATLRARHGSAGRRVRIPGARPAFQIASDNGQTVIVAQRGARVAVAYGRKAAADALHPRALLGDDPRYAKARSALGGGMKPMVLLSNPQMAVLASGAGIGGGIRRSLRALELVTIGGALGRDAIRVRVAATFRG